MNYIALDSQKKSQSELYQLFEYLSIEDTKSPTIRTYAISTEADDSCPEYIQDLIKAYAIKEVMYALGMDRNMPNSDYILIDDNPDDCTVTIRAIDPVNKTHAFYHTWYQRVW